MATAGQVTHARVAARGIPIFSRLARKPSHCAQTAGRSRVRRRARVEEHPFDLARAIVDRPPEPHRDLPVAVEIRQDARRRDGRDIDDDVQAVAVHRDGEGARAVWLERRVAGSDVYPHALLQEGGKLLVDHRKITSIAAFKKLLGSVQVLLRTP